MHSSYKWEEYNSWREKDGFLCRNSSDCNWVDPKFKCRDYELRLAVTPSKAWFGGNNAYLEIVGSCDCPDGMFFDDDEMECRRKAMPIAAFLGIDFAVCILALICVCVCCFYAAKKFL